MAPTTSHSQVFVPVFSACISITSSRYHVLQLHFSHLHQVLRPAAAEGLRNAGLRQFSVPHFEVARQFERIPLYSKERWSTRYRWPTRYRWSTRYVCPRRTCAPPGTGGPLGFSRRDAQELEKGEERIGPIKDGLNGAQTPLAWTFPVAMVRAGNAIETCASTTIQFSH
jgi:hypothetical protein